MRRNKPVFAVRMIGEIRVETHAHVAYLHSSMSYGIICWGNASNKATVCRVQKRIIRPICGVYARTAGRNLFKERGIRTTASQYIHCLMQYVVNSEAQFPSNSSVHNINTRYNNNRHTDLQSPTLAQQRGTIARNKHRHESASNHQERGCKQTAVETQFERHSDELHPILHR